LRLRYVGLVPTTFMHSAVGEVQPGGVFAVPDEDADGFLARRDVEQAPEPEAEARPRKAAIAVKPAVEPAPASKPEPGAASAE
jgi:hypothetical protein